MIISLLFLVASFFISLVAVLFSSFGFVFPPQLFSWIPSVLSVLGYFSGVVDLSRFVSDLVIVINFEIFWYLFLIAWFIFGFFRSLFSVGGTPGH